MEEMPDISKILDIFSRMNSNNNETSKEDVKSVSNFSDSNFEMPDMETIMKLSKIMKIMNSNQNNASTNLLNSLKPFLRKTKQDKLEQYIKMLQLSSVISELKIFDI